MENFDLPMNWKPYKQPKDKESLRKSLEKQILETTKNFGRLDELPSLIEEVKQEVAEDHGFTNWHHLIESLIKSNEITLMKIYIDEVIEIYADEKIEKELDAPAEEFDNKVLKLLKSMTLSMAAHPDCFKRPDGAASEFYNLVEIAEKVLEGTLDTRNG